MNDLSTFLYKRYMTYGGNFSVDRKCKFLFALRQTFPNIEKELERGIPQDISKDSLSLLSMVSHR